MRLAGRDRCTGRSSLMIDPGTFKVSPILASFKNLYVLCLIRWITVGPGSTFRPMTRRLPGSPPDAPDVYTAGYRVEGRVRWALPARRPYRPAVEDLSRPGSGRIDRRGGYQAEARVRHRAAHHGGHRPGRDVGQRLPLRRSRAAPLPGLRGDEPRRPRVDCPGGQRDQ